MIAARRGAARACEARGDRHGAVTHWEALATVPHGWLTREDIEEMDLSLARLYHLTGDARDGRL